MKIISNSINVYFQTISNIRESFFAFEKAFPSFAQPFTLIPIPDGTPPELPRITAVTEHLHSNLIVTAQNVQVLTNYDDNFSNDIEKCWDYFSQKKQELLSSVKNIIKAPLLFCGITTILQFTDIDPVKSILERFIKTDTKSKLYDVSTRFAFSIDDFYVNIEVQTARNYEGLQTGSLQSLSTLTESGKFLQVILDVNDRNGFNSNRNYTSDENKIEEIYRKSRYIVANHIEDFINTGRIDL